VKVLQTALDGVVIIEPQRFEDERGFLMETYHRRRYADIGISPDFVQDNLSRSAKGILRGLHYQLPHSQGKLVQVLRGAVFDVAVDIRRGSPNFGKWTGIELSEENRCQLWVPPGFAHGFVSLMDDTDFIYKCTDTYAPEAECAIRWNDPKIGIAWPISEPSLSNKDAVAPFLHDQTTLPDFNASF